MSNGKRSLSLSHKFLRVVENGYALDTKNTLASLMNVDTQKSPMGSIVYAKVSSDGKRGEIERMPSYIPATEAALEINELLRESNAKLRKNREQLEDQNHKLEEDRLALERVRQEVEEKKLEKAALTKHIEAQQTEQGQLTEGVSKLQEKTAKGRQTEKDWLDKANVLKSEIEELEHRKQAEADELERLRNIVWRDAVKAKPYTQKLKHLERHIDETLAVKETLETLRESGYSVDKLDLVALR